MSPIKIGINGFGRIGRAVARLALDNPAIELVAINTRKGKNELMAYLLQYDTVYRKYHKTVVANDKGLMVDGKQIATTLADKPENIPWEQYGVQVVVDATGAFTKSEDLTKHIKDTVKRVVLTAPAKDDTPTIVLGVNESDELLKSPVLSNASCTTNCAAPLFKVLNDSFGIVMGQMTTIHAYTMTQSMMDDANKEMERSRSAVSNIVPSSSGAAKAVVKVVPDLKGKIEVFAVRVPVPVGSASDLAVVLSREVTPDEVNAAFQAASQNSMQGILGYATDLLVSSDIIGSTYSTVFDPRYTKVTAGKMVKVFGWYDNEWGYSCRVIDLVVKMSKFI
ncbi:MAG TPA: type I glyceraldehyde-3-phosphate dehydrogenase [Candidatus Woesebacteria bacterium]|nr:type I glyceraldehyde-3-phosphate dehydrogenase [Candidatus Woesebacteria bacterium]HNS95075.1 type I glyceraldehyde-3-phosphate dehydrogenase [Candidatus Woesebacteria bacterium]